MSYFTQQTFTFLADLAQNNERTWFEAHQQDYENFVRTPALDFISDMSDEMHAISRHYLAQPKKIGGSLMRIYRDTRFSKDKTPYKTNIGIQFRHETAKDVHAPGYYLHIATDGCFVGAGVWHPDANVLFKIRCAIAEKSAAWLAARDAEKFRTSFMLAGDALINAPRGFAKDHPLLDDLKRKDFIGIAPLTPAAIKAKNLPMQVAEHFQNATPLMRFLCQAVEVQF
ncbi:MAG: DUF2461 domain-containing protein [Nitrosomonadales bacterium]|nr:DUF2461 domain-containing protein [Nitrosomonadales bacterium]